MNDAPGPQRPEGPVPPTQGWQPPLAPTGPYQQAPPPGYPPQGPPSSGYYPPPPSPYPGAYGQPQWQPGGYGPPPGFPMGPPPRRKRRGGLILAAVTAAALLALGVTAFWAPGFLRTEQLDIDAVQGGVRQVLTDTANGYGAGEVTDVRCNNGANPTIESGATFGCEATINGTTRQVEVTFADDRGTYWVGAPT